MHADVIAGRQINQTLNRLIKKVMNKHVTPPFNSSLATSYVKSIMASSEGRVAAVFTGGVSSSAEGELAIDETASTVSLASNVCVVPGVSRAVEEGEKCIEEVVDPVSGEDSAVRHLEREVDDNDSFVDIMSGITAVGGVESEGWTFADALARANLSVQTLAEVLLTRLVCLHVSLLSSFPISVQSVGNNMVTTHIFHKLVISARLFMKKASWGCCVLVFESSGEPAVHLEISDSCAPGLSLRLGAPLYARIVLAPQYLLPWIMSQI